MFHRVGGVLLCGLAVGAVLSGCANYAGEGPTASLNYPVRTQAWDFGGLEGAKLSTENYNLFTTLQGGTARQSMPAFLEAAHENYIALTGLTASADPTSTPQRKLPVYLFANRGQWAALTEQVTGPAAETYLKVQNGGYSYAGTCVFWYIGTMGTFNIAAHEGMHQFLHYAARESLPVWAEEGLAVLSEGYRIHDGLVRFGPRENHSRMTTLRRLIMADRWRGVKRLVEMSATENVEENSLRGADYYAQLWAMLLLIRSDPQYAEGLRQLCRDAGAGTMHEALGISPRAWVRLQHNAAAYVQVIGPKAFAHYIDADTARFEARYRAFAEKLAQIPKS